MRTRLLGLMLAMSFAITAGGAAVLFVQPFQSIGLTSLIVVVGAGLSVCAATKGLFVGLQLPHEVASGGQGAWLLLGALAFVLGWFLGVFASVGLLFSVASPGFG